MATYASAYSSYQQPPKHQPPAAAASSRPSYPPSQQQQSQQSSSSTWMQPPYPGAPPMPAGVSVNPQQWQSGYWQFNPQYNRNRNSNQQHVPWIPSHHWMPQGSNQQSQQQPQSTASQQQAAQQVSHNPYKRVPRPPSAEYLATQLVDNPLGLSGLDEPNKYYDKTQTPWVWQPRDLEDDAEEDSSPISESSPSNSRKNSDNPKDDPEHFTSRRELQTTFSINIVRTPDHYRRNSVGSLDHSSPSRTPSRGSRSSVESALSGRMSQLTTNSGTGSLGSIPKSVSPNPLSRQTSMPTTLSSASSFSISPTKPDFSGPVLGGDQLSDEPASILSPLMFSQTPKTGPSSLRSLRNNYTHPLIPSGLDPIPESSQRNVNGTPSKSKDRRPAPVGHSSSMPAIPNGPSGYPSHRDSFDKDRDRERSRESRDRDHPGLGSRHTTVIDINTASNPYSNPLQRSSSPSASSPHQFPSRSSSRQSSRSNSAHASPTYSSHHASPPVNYTSESRPSPPQAPPSKRSPPEAYHHHSSLSTSSVKTISPGSYPSGSSSTPGPDSSNINMPRLPNPLPPPPQHAQASRYAYASVQRTPPAHYDHRIRRGFWNRRGDHLTQQGYIVYAPPDKAFPADLRNYPAQDEGYQDQDGVFTTYVNRPELPESLPRHGRPADSPYETFVVYDYR